jgi:hypothetical protein
MLGGHTGPPVAVGGDQLIPATIHWDQGWVRIRAAAGQIDAVVRPKQLDVTGSDPGPIVITFHAANVDPAKIEDQHWALPGLNVDVTCDSFPLAPPATTGEGVEVRYPPTTLRLAVSPA